MGAGARGLLSHPGLVPGALDEEEEEGGLQWRSRGWERRGQGGERDRRRQQPRGCLQQSKN